MLTLHVISSQGAWRCERPHDCTYDGRAVRSDTVSVCAGQTAGVEREEATGNWRLEETAQ